MLESRIRTPEETARYMEELRAFLRENRDLSTEGMADFFASRLSGYEAVHLCHWGEEYAHIADYFDSGLETLLDIGCGTGLELDSLYRRFPRMRVTGVDLSRDMLNRLEAKYQDRGITLIQADYFQYPLGTEQYDAALSFETLHHFPYEKKGEIYKRLFRALRPGGYYVECDYIACCEEEERLCREQYDYRRRRDGVPEGEFVHIDIPLTLEHQRELILDGGFRSVRVLYENQGTMLLRAEKPL